MAINQRVNLFFLDGVIYFAEPEKPISGGSKSFVVMCERISQEALWDWDARGAWRDHLHDYYFEPTKGRIRSAVLRSALPGPRNKNVVVIFRQRISIVQELAKLTRTVESRTISAIPSSILRMCESSYEAFMSCAFDKNCSVQIPSIIK
jgi:hypothetical protein